MINKISQNLIRIFSYTPGYVGCSSDINCTNPDRVPYDPAYTIQSATVELKQAPKTGSVSQSCIFDTFLHLLPLFAFNFRK